MMLVVAADVVADPVLLRMLPVVVVVAAVVVAVDVSELHRLVAIAATADAVAIELY